MHEIAESEVPTVSGSLFWIPMMSGILKSWRNKLTHLVRPEHLLHFTDEIWIRNGKRINPKLRHQKREGWIFQPSLELCLMAPSTVMLKRELLEQCGLFDEELPVCEDYDLWLRITAHHQVSFLNEALMTRSEDMRINSPGNIGEWTDSASNPSKNPGQCPSPERKMKWQQDVS